MEIRCSSSVLFFENLNQRCKSILYPHSVLTDSENSFYFSLPSLSSKKTKKDFPTSCTSSVLKEFIIVRTPVIEGLNDRNTIFCSFQP